MNVVGREKAEFFWLDKQSDRFEAAWRAGDRPQIEEYLDPVGEPRRQALLRELVSLEIELRGISGEQPSREEYQARFPGDVVVVDEVFQGAIAAMTTRLQPPVAIDQPESPSASPVSSGAPIAPLGFTILGVLGRGGMGVVFKAQQERPRREVALKVIRPELASEEMMRRFGQESHLLGRLQHPAIAQIYEVGSLPAPEGATPYFAMELVKGLPLTKWVEERGLDDRECVQLMIRVCEAVQHAHQRGIIHRDLKPANILVDDSGQPKVLDFGLARAIEPIDGLELSLSESAFVPGTIKYMSPEQAAGLRMEVDTQSDVYALGLIAYELLAHRHAFQLAGLPRLEALRVMARGGAPPLHQIRPALRGDLSTVVSKALEVEKFRRYDSVSQLASDLQNYLNRQPISARPSSATYQLSMFARRNKPLVAVAAALVIGLVVAVAGLGWARVADARRTQAELGRRDDQLRAAQQREIATLSHAAELALRRGQWADALANLEQASAAGRSDNVAARLDEIRALDGLNRLTEAMARLQEIQSLARTGRLRLTEEQASQVRLRQADFLRGRGSPQNHLAEELTREAIDGELPEEEREYALGLTATTSEDAIDRFRRAVAVDSFHHRARLTLALACLSRGDIDATNQELGVAEALFPDDPNVKLLQMAANLLHGKYEAAASYLDSAEPGLSGEQFQAIRTILEEARGLMASLDPSNLSNSGIASYAKALPRLLPALVILREQQEVRPLKLLATPPSYLRTYVSELYQASANAASSPMNFFARMAFLRAMGIQPLDEAGIGDALVRAAAVNPEGLVLTMMAAMEFDHGSFDEVERLTREALGRPSLFLPQLVRRQCLELRLGAHGGQLLDLGITSWPAEETRVLAIPQPNPQRVADIVQRLLPDLGEYQEIVQGVPSPALTHIVVGLTWIAGARERAVALAREGLARSPGDTKLRKRLDSMEARLGDPSAMVKWAEWLEKDHPGSLNASLWRFRAIARCSEIRATVGGADPPELPFDPFAP